MSYDPTRTTLLRRKFIREMNRRFGAVISAIKRLLVEEDALGLRPFVPFTFNAKSIHNQLVLNQPQQWKFLQDSDKVKSFRRWLQQQVSKEILTPIGGISGKPWTAEYIESAYKKGLLRSYMDARRGDLFDTDDFYRGSQQQFLRSAFGSPETVKKVELIYTRAFNDLEGITSQMDAKISRILADGLVAGKSPTVIAKTMAEDIGKLTRMRAMTIARTEIIHAHAEGQLEAFEQLGIEEVGAEVEWSTSGDGKVCDECDSLEGQIYTIEKARGLIPLHPNCRCAWLPVVKTT